MDGETLTAPFVFAGREQDCIDQSLDRQQTPHTCTEFSNKSLPLEAAAFVEVHHSNVAMDADESKKYSAAVKM